MTKINKALFKKALFEAQMTEINRIEKLPEVSLSHSAEYLNKIDGIFEGSFKKPVSAFAHRVKTVIIILVILILTAASAACIPIIRKYKVEFNDKDGGINISGDISEGSTQDYRHSIEDIYRPSYIPEGYVEVYYSLLKSGVLTAWENHGKTIALTQRVINESSFISIDGECEYTEMTIGRYKIYRATYLYDYKFFWEHDGYFFMLFCPNTLEDSEIKRIIKSLDN